ncbi:hypothetical protein EF902_01815 [Streptomyces sp. WAC05858]|nr:hypothetical protein EF902_01815 [Streptomyces sp. WAC05858]
MVPALLLRHERAVPHRRLGARPCRARPDRAASPQLTPHLRDRPRRPHPVERSHRIDSEEFCRLLDGVTLHDAEVFDDTRCGALRAAQAVYPGVSGRRKFSARRSMAMRWVGGWAPSLRCCAPSSRSWLIFAQMT